jgi:hypothetical protein
LYFHAASGLTCVTAFIAKAGNAENVKEGRTERQRTASILIQKMTMLPRSAIAVESWAFSPRLRHNFGGNIDWLPFPEVPTVGVSADDQVVDETILSYARLGSLTQRSQKIYDDACRNVKKALAKESCRMHAECVILLHSVEAMRHAQETGAEPVRFCDYIAVSELCCPCCHAFIEEWNKQHQTKWVTSGCHHKPYKWSIMVPDQDQPDEAYSNCVKAVWSKITAYFPGACELRFTKERTQNKLRSDSSGEDNDQAGAGHTNSASRRRARLVEQLDAIDAPDDAD